jgi:hypothetical protein
VVALQRLRRALRTGNQSRAPAVPTLKAAIQAAGVGSDIAIAETLTTLLAEYIIETDHFAGEIDDLEGDIDALVRKILCCASVFEEDTGKRCHALRDQAQEFLRLAETHGGFAETMARSHPILLATYDQSMRRRSQRYEKPRQ